MAKESPRYEALKNALRASIDSGEYAEGAQLPSESELINKFGLSRHQVREALRELELEGYLQRLHGRGSFVTPRSARSAGFRFIASNTVALCFPQYTSYYARQIVEGFMRHMSNEGRQVVAYNVLYDNNSEYEFLQTVADSGVEGFAIWLGHMNDRVHGLLEGLIRSRFPLVLIDRYFPDLGTDCVASDNEDIGYRLTQAMLARGHERIAFITTDEPRLSSANERRNGFLRAMRDAGRLDADALTVIIGADEAGCRLPLAEAMALANRPTCLCCVNDLVAELVSRQLDRFGYKVGKDVEMASVDDDHVSEAAGIPMVRLVQPAYDIGVHSAQCLLNRIADPEHPAQRVFLKAGPIIADRVDAAAAPADASHCPEAEGSDAAAKTQPPAA